MGQDDESRPGERHTRERRRSWLWILVALCALLIFIAVFVPNLDVNMRQHRNEASTVFRLRRLNELENKFAASYPEKGFACQLPLVKPPTHVDETYDPNEFLVTGTQNGYRFAVTNCRTGPNGAVSQYQVTAVPLEPGKSGFRASCTEQTGVICYDSDGSAERCLASKRQLR